MTFCFKTWLERNFLGLSLWFWVFLAPFSRIFFGFFLLFFLLFFLFFFVFCHLFGSEWAQEGNGKRKISLSFFSHFPLVPIPALFFSSTISPFHWFCYSVPILLLCSVLLSPFLSSIFSSSFSSQTPSSLVHDASIFLWCYNLNRLKMFSSLVDSISLKHYLHSKRFLARFFPFLLSFSFFLSLSRYFPPFTVFPVFFLLSSSLPLTSHSPSEHHITLYFIAEYWKPNIKCWTLFKRSKVSIHHC